MKYGALIEKQKQTELKENIFKKYYLKVFDSLLKKNKAYNKMFKKLEILKCVIYCKYYLVCLLL